jgi:hypothetical protein
MFQTKVVEKIRTRVSYSVTFLRKSYRLLDNVEKGKKNIVEPGRTRHDNMAQAHHILYI